MKQFKMKCVEFLQSRTSTRNLLMSAIAVTSLAVAACSPVEVAVDPVFPEKQSIAVAAEEMQTTISFSANVDWTLTSSESWCSFVQNDKESYSISGTAGDQKITVRISEDAQQIGEKGDVAVIEIMMGGQKEVLAEVLRSALPFSIQLTDAEGKPLKETEQFVEAGYEQYVSFYVKANFKFSVVSYPEWVKLDGDALSGSKNQITRGKLKIKPNGNIEKYPVSLPEKVTEETPCIVFASSDSKYKFSLPVIYKGLPEGTFSIKGNEGIRKDWNVSLDGKTFTQTSGNSSSAFGGDEVVEDKLGFTILCPQDNFKILYIHEVEQMGMKQMVNSEADPSINWMNLSKDKATGSYNLTVAANGLQERKGWVLAIPSENFESFVMNEEYFTMDQETYLPVFDYENAGKYLVAEVLQEAKPSPFKVEFESWGVREPETLAAETDKAILDLFPGCSEVYSIVMRQGNYHISQEEEGLTAVGGNSNIKNPDDVYLFEAEEPIFLQFYAELEPDQLFYAKFNDAEGKLVKVLVFKPYVE